MATKNFTLAGLAASVQFGKGFAILKATSSTQFQARDDTDSAFANVAGLDAVAVTDFVTLAQLNAVSVGVSWKTSVRLCEQTNISIVSAPATIDGIAPTIGDRIALTAQSTGSENGLWVWNGAAVALTRPTDWASTTNQSGSAFFIREGTCADDAYVATADPAVVDTDDPLLLLFASVSAGVTSIVSVNDGGGGGTFCSLVVNGAAPVPEIASISNGSQIACATSGGSNQVDLSIVALSVDTAELAADAVTEPKLAAGVAVLYRHLQIGFADFPGSAGDSVVSVGAVLPTGAIVSNGVVCVTQAFDSDPELAVGGAASTDLFANSEVDLNAIGSCLSSNCSSQSGNQLSATLTTVTSQPTVGSAEIIAEFIRP